MKNNLKSKRLTRALVCGLIGVLVLSVSAFAAYGSTSGYGKYKDAVKDLIINTDNVTYHTSAAVKIDGKTLNKSVCTTKLDGKNGWIHSKSIGGTESSYETYYSVIDGVATHYNVDETVYNQYESDVFTNDFAFGGYSKQVANFGSLLADTLLGDLKNNVVLVSEEDGISNYSLNIKADQVPPLISAGLELMKATENTLGYTSYEDDEATFAAFYQKKTGEALPENYFDKLYDSEDDDLWDQYNELWDEMDQEYTKILEDQYHNEAIIYVNPDGSYTAYTSYDQFIEAHPSSDSITDYLGTTAVLDDVTCNVSLDKDNHLIDNTFNIAFTKTGSDGETHRVEYELELHFSDYGTTHATAVDPGTRTLEAQE